MKITHNNKNYILDPERAIDLGVLKLESRTLRAGDVFYRNGITVVLVAEQFPNFTMIWNCDKLQSFEGTVSQKEYNDGCWLND